MKRKIFSLMLALMVCVSMAFSTSDLVKAESAHSECGHYGPPNVEKQDLGYGVDDIYHWKRDRYIARCSGCDYLLEVRVVNGEKEVHVRYGNKIECSVCHYELKLPVRYANFQ